MGVFDSKSKKKTTNITTYEIDASQDNSNLGGQSESGDVFAVRGDGNTFSTLDGGAIETAFRFARDSLGTVERNASASQKSFETALQSTLAIADDAKTAGNARLMWIALAAFAVFAFR